MDSLRDRFYADQHAHASLLQPGPGGNAPQTHFRVSDNTTSNATSNASSETQLVGWGGQAFPQNTQGRVLWFGRNRSRQGGLRGARNDQFARNGAEGAALQPRHSNGLIQESLSVEDVVALIQRLNRTDPVPQHVYNAFYSFDSRTMSLLLKDLSRMHLAYRAIEVFDYLRRFDAAHPITNLCDVYTYTAMISMCVHVERALELLDDMRIRNIERNVHTYTALMNVCIKCGKLPQALEVYKDMRAVGCTPNVVTFNTLIDVYGKLGQWENASQVLQVMKAEGVPPVSSTYNALIIACNTCNQPREALAVYDQMLAEGVPASSTTYNALITAYGKIGQREKAIEVHGGIMVAVESKTFAYLDEILDAAEKHKDSETWTKAHKLLGYVVGLRSLLHAAEPNDAQMMDKLCQSLESVKENYLKELHEEDHVHFSGTAEAWWLVRQQALSLDEKGGTSANAGSGKHIESKPVAGETQVHSQELEATFGGGNEGGNGAVSEFQGGNAGQEPGAGVELGQRSDHGGAEASGGDGDYTLAASGEESSQLQPLTLETVEAFVLKCIDSLQELQIEVVEESIPEPPCSAYDVFISHAVFASRDHQVASTLQKRLHDVHRLEVFWQSGEELDTGDHASSEGSSATSGMQGRKDALNGAASVVVIVSLEFAKDQGLMDELHGLLKKQQHSLVTIFPVWCGTGASELPKEAKQFYDNECPGVWKAQKQQWIWALEELASSPMRYELAHEPKEAAEALVAHLKQSGWSAQGIGTPTRQHKVHDAKLAEQRAEEGMTLLEPVQPTAAGGKSVLAESQIRNDQVEAASPNVDILISYAAGAVEVQTAATDLHTRLQLLLHQQHRGDHTATVFCGLPAKEDGNQAKQAVISAGASSDSDSSLKYGDALNDALAAVVFLSLEFTRDKRHMDDLHYLLEKQRLGLVVIFPVWCNVSPGEILEEAARFYEQQWEKRTIWKEQQERWMAALHSIARSKLDNHGNALGPLPLQLQHVCEAVTAHLAEWGRIRHPVRCYSKPCEALQAYDSQNVKSVKALVKERNVALIHGLEGCGKTFLARMVYQELSNSLPKDAVCMCLQIEEGVHTKEPDNLTSLQQQLLRRLDVFFTPATATDGRAALQSALKGKQVLLLVDNVSVTKFGNLLEFLLPEDALAVAGEESMLLVTSRQKGVAMFHSIRGFAAEYEVPLMDEKVARALAWKVCRDRVCVAERPGDAGVPKGLPEAEVSSEEGPALEQILDGVHITVREPGVGRYYIPLLVVAAANPSKDTFRKSAGLQPEGADPTSLFKEQLKKLEPELLYPKLAHAYSQLDVEQQVALHEVVNSLRGCEWDNAAVCCGYCTLRGLVDSGWVTTVKGGDGALLVEVHDAVVRFLNKAAKADGDGGYKPQLKQQTPWDGQGFLPPRPGFAPPPASVYAQTNIDDQSFLALNFGGTGKRGKKGLPPLAPRFPFGAQPASPTATESSTERSMQADNNLAFVEDSHAQQQAQEWKQMYIDALKQLRQAHSSLQHPSQQYSPSPGSTPIGASTGHVQGFDDVRGEAGSGQEQGEQQGGQGGMPPSAHQRHQLAHEFAQKNWQLEAQEWKQMYIDALKQLRQPHSSLQHRSQQYSPSPGSTPMGASTGHFQGPLCDVWGEAGSGGHSGEQEGGQGGMPPSAHQQHQIPHEFVQKYRQRVLGQDGEPLPQLKPERSDVYMLDREGPSLVTAPTKGSIVFDVRPGHTYTESLTPRHDIAMTKLSVQMPADNSFSRPASFSLPNSPPPNPSPVLSFLGKLKRRVEHSVSARMAGARDTKGV